MKTIKLSLNNLPYICQTPSNAGVWGDYKFVINDESCKECDYWFIADYAENSKDNVAICPKENVYLILGETEDIRHYNKHFVEQFHNIISLQSNNFNVPQKYSGVINYWFVGLHFSNGKVLPEHKKSFDTLSKLNIQDVPKTKLMSIVSSNKSMCEGHRLRLEFAKRIKEHFGDSVDFFGRGIKPFADKWDVVAPYKYHIAIENSVHDDYITEKFLDPMLSFTMPIYYGANNISDYYDTRSYLKIDIKNPDKAIKDIENAVKDNIYEKNLKFIEESRDKILHKYNMFQQIIDIVSENNYSGKPTKNVIHYESWLPFKIENRIRGMK